MNYNKQLIYKLIKITLINNSNRFEFQSLAIYLVLTKKLLDIELPVIDFMVVIVDDEIDDEFCPG